MPYIGRNHIAGDHTSNFKVLDDISSYTATFDGSASSVVDTTNNTIRVVEHRFIQGQRVTYTNGGGGNIGGLTTGTAYFVIFDSASTIKLATSASNAANSTAINLSSVGSGSSHTLNAAFDGINKKFKLTHGSGTGARLNNSTQINVAINNVVQRPNLDPNNFTDGFALEDNHKIVFQTAPTSEDIFWGSIIANTLTTFDISDHKIDTFTGDGSTTEFTLSHTPANNESLMVTINGVLQHPSNASTARAYTLIASIIQFTAAPGVGDEIQVRHLGFAGATTADVSGFYGRTGNVALTSSDNITIGDIPTVRNINASGIITATTFDGAFSSGVGGSNANFTGIVTAGTFKGGNIDAVDGAFSGNVTIGGTLTYEDVTNIDSVGIITAQTDVHVGAGLSVVGVSTLTDLTVEKSGNLNVNIKSTGGWGALEVGGATAGYIDIKKPFSDDFDLRFMVDGSGTNYITSNAAPLKLNAQGATGIELGAYGAPSLKYNNDTKLVTTSAGVSIPKDLDVDGHTNLDNVSIVGVTTITGTGSSVLFLESSNPMIRLTDTDNSAYSSIGGESGNLYLYTNSSSRDFIFRGSAEVARITGDGLLGIGTHTPTAPIHLHKASGDIIQKIESSNGAAALELRHTNGYGYIRYFQDGTETFRAGQIAQFTSYSIYNPSSSLPYQFCVEGNGEVGINTHNPIDTLHLLRNSANHGITLQRGGTNPGTAYVQVHSNGVLSLQGGNNIHYVSGGSQQHIWYRAGTEIARFNTSGSLGIGTATIRNNRTVQITGASQSNLLITGNVPSVCLNPDPDDSTDGDRTFLGQAAGSNNFANGTAAGDTILRGTSSGKIHFGIGTAIKMHLTSAGDLNIGSVGRFDASGIVKTAHGSESAPSHTFLNDPDNGMYRPTTNTLGFVTGGTERLRIASDGDVTLTATGDPTLKVIGPGQAQLTLTTTSGTDHCSINFGDSSDHDAGEIRYTNSDNSLNFDTAGVERMTISSTGKFGINQASPQYSMHMSPAHGESRIDLHMTNSTTGHNNTDGVQFGYQNTAGAYIWNFENTPIYMAVNNLKRFEIDTSGYLKLLGRNVQGSANGDKLLRIYQPSRTDAEEDVLLLQTYNTSSANNIIIGGGDSSFNAATQITFRTGAINTTSGTERVRITSTGDFQEKSDGTNWYNVVTGYDIGTNPNEIPINQMLGGMAYMDPTNYEQVYEIPSTNAEQFGIQSDGGGLRFGTVLGGCPDRSVAWPDDTSGNPIDLWVIDFALSCTGVTNSGRNDLYLKMRYNTGSTTYGDSSTEWNNWILARGSYSNTSTGWNQVNNNSASTWGRAAVYMDATQYATGHFIVFRGGAGVATRPGLMWDFNYTHGGVGACRAFGSAHATMGNDGNTSRRVASLTYDLDAETWGSNSQANSQNIAGFIRQRGFRLQ